jgi:tetratricopeptide (TPR) repeat protein
LRELLKSLEISPELTLEDLNEIKIPLDLFDVIPLAFCKKYKTLPLRLDKSSGILSFIFADPLIYDELENLRKNQGWTQLSSFKVSEHTLEVLLDQCEKALEAESPLLGWNVALIEPSASLNAALSALLKTQGYSVTCFANEETFLESIEEISQNYNEEDDILNIHENNRTLPHQAVVVREKVLKAPKKFCKDVWDNLGSMRINILEDRWLHRILEKSLSSPEVVSNDFEFYIRHEDFYHAGIESLKQGNLFQAVELLEQVKPENAYFIKAKIILGKAFLSKKNFNKAGTHFQQAYDHWCLDPVGIVDETVLKLLYHLAYTFEKLNRPDDALKLYERVAGENPNFKEIVSRMARVKEKRRKVNSANEKKMGLPAFSKHVREKTSRYERIEEIGRGGMGIVYRARDRVLGREIALKVLSSHFKHDEKIVETFLREAKSLAALNHLHIVTIFDAGIEEGNYYIAMEFIEGKTARELLKKKGFFRMQTALILARQVLRALAYAHSKHVIHRDITTNNMMLTENKIIKLMDFGLARVVNQLHSEQSIIGGTPYFMSPEQVEGAPIDHRTDIYSFGICFYEMLTGQVTFPMENPGYHHLHTTPPDPREIKPDIPEEACRLILKCLEKKADKRFQSANEVLHALKSIPDDIEPTLVITPKGKKKKK